MSILEQQSLGQRLHIDFPLLFAIFVLCLIGLLVLYSAGGQDIQLVYRQAVKLLIAFVGMIMIAQLSPAILERWSIWLFIFGIILLVLVIFYGDVGKGAQRWLDLKVFRFQPSEIMKLTVPMMIASYLADKSLPPKFSWVLMTCVLILIPVLLIAKQPDLGTALLVATAGFSVLFIAGISWRLLMSMGVLAAACAPILWYVMHDYQKRRVLTLLNPEEDPLGAGYHIIQSKIAIGSGGFYGKGWLKGTQSHLEFLPERSTDFIFAVFCEEFGMLGVLLLLCVYLFIISRGLFIAINAQNTYGRLLASSLTLTFFVYVFVNIGMVTGQLPVVGVPLPLISHGGTSMVTLMLGFGIIMSVHTHRRFLSF
ncbi:MAG TPA: rod shape-determining protein RodA [Thiotrichaceae bacterium]|nr:rod shape-determining protein RodA [Thiotrichaceae bacterium]HIM07930.1 rod shape-determining protein RodA [Gammaproteobacteria bacterium]